MYFASADPLSQGTTRLHLDMTSAINCMAWTTDETGPVGTDTVCQDGSGCPRSGAHWIIFDPHDTSKLAAYLRARNKLSSTDPDPIHAQQTFITKAMLAELSSQGIYPYVVHQKAGQAVFIPAGAAHQVRIFLN